MRRTTALVSLLLAMFLLAPAAAAVTIEPVPGLARPKPQEVSISASENYLAYQRRMDGDVVVRFRSRETGEDTVADINGDMYVAGFLDGTDSLLVVRQAGGDSNVYLYDPVAETLTPVGVNSAQWEYSAQISDAFVLVVRSVAGRAFVSLYDRVTQDETALGDWDLQRADTRADGVGDRYASWTVCTRRTCKVYVYDAVNETTTIVPTTASLAPQYGSTVDEDNDRLYFVRSGPRCGERVRFRVAALSDLSLPSSVVIGLPAGVDLGSTHVQVFHEAGLDQDDLYFTRFDCGNGRTDAYVLRDVP